MLYTTRWGCFVMSWIPLAERFEPLLLILAGPMLRSVGPHAVTVWVALKEARTVTLRVYSRTDNGELVQHIEGTQHTVRLGEHLHIVAVTAHVARSRVVRVSGPCCALLGSVRVC